MFYVNENMSDFLLFEYWQTVANGWLAVLVVLVVLAQDFPCRTFVCICPVCVSEWVCMWVFAVCCPGPKNDKCVGFWLKLRLQLAYFSFNQQANKGRLLWLYVGVAGLQWAWHIGGGRTHYFVGMTFAGSRLPVACLPIIDNLIWPKCLGGCDK